ncbi:MAG: response regulator transcription factor [Deinococcales bacterium]
MTRILVIEDDEALRELLVLHLEQAAFQVIEAASAEVAWDKLSWADVVVLDWMLPELSGVEWLEQLRKHRDHAHLPVLMLTARASERDKVEGLSSGADDYLSKPFSTAELIARIKALMRRAQLHQALQVGEVKIQELEGTASFKGKELKLTRREFELLAFLVKHQGRIFNRNELLDHVWGEDFLGTERTVDQHIAQLRALIGSDYIETIRARGYRLIEPEI